MNNKEYTTAEEERILKNALSDITKELSNKEYKQAFRSVKLEFIKNTIDELFSISNYSNFSSLADLLNNDLKLNCYKLKLVMLNGASNFEEWSFDGCGMVYNDDLREAFRRPKASGAELLKLQAYCYYSAYLELSNLLSKKLSNFYEKK